MTTSTINKAPFWHPIVGQGFLQGNFREYVQTIKMDLARWRPTMIVLHNTGEPMLKDWHVVAGKQRMQNLEHYYRDFMHWSGGPHLFIADDLIWVFNPLEFPGVHSPSWNKIAWGIETVGNYEVEALPPSVHDNLVTALATLIEKCDIHLDQIKLHRQDPLTTHHGCPGKNISQQEIVEAAQGKLVQWGVSTS